MSEVIVEDKKKKIIDASMDEINKKFRKGSDSTKPLIFRASDHPELITPEFYASGITPLDEALGGGWPLGSACVIHGTPFSGKTSLALCTAARMTKEKKYVLYINLEGIKLGTFLSYGIDTEYLYELGSLDNAEQVVDTLEGFLFDKASRSTKGVFDLIIVDSLNNLVTESEINTLEKDGAAASPQMARRAHLIDGLLKRIYGRQLLRDGTILLMIAQDRANLDSNTNKYVKTVMSCGESLKFNSKVTVKLTRKPTKAKVNGIERVIGHTVGFDIEKNSIWGDVGKGEYSVIYKVGLDDSAALFQKASMPEWGYIVSGSKRGAYKFLLPVGDIEVQGKPAAIELIKVQPVIAQSLRDLLSGAKPKTPPTGAGFEFKIEVEKTDDELEEE